MTTLMILDFFSSSPLSTAWSLTVWQISAKIREFPLSPIFSTRWENKTCILAGHFSACCVTQAMAGHGRKCKRKMFDTSCCLDNVNNIFNSLEDLFKFKYHWDLKPTHSLNSGRRDIVINLTRHGVGMGEWSRLFMIKPECLLIFQCTPFDCFTCTPS